MNSTFIQKKYEIGCSGSGWGVWEIESGKKVESFCSSKIGRIYALELMYELNGWKKPINFK